MDSEPEKLEGLTVYVYNMFHVPTPLQVINQQNRAQGRRRKHEQFLKIHKYKKFSIVRNVFKIARKRGGVKRGTIAT